MPSKGESMANIKCDQCGAEMDFAPLYYREGDLEITCVLYFEKNVEPAKRAGADEAVLVGRLLAGRISDLIEHG